MIPWRLLVVVAAVLGVFLVTAATASAGELDGPLNQSEFDAACPPSDWQYFSMADNNPYMYVWTNDGGAISCKYDDVITDAQFLEEEDELVAAGDEATGATIPADIASSDASVGARLWDGLSSAASSVKGSAMDFLSGIGDWPAFGTIGESLGTVGFGASTFYVGWKIGTWVDGLLGIGNNGCTTTCGNDSFVAVHAVSAGEDVCDFTGGPGVAATLCTTSNFVGGGCGNCSITSVTDEYAPSDGWVAQFSNGNSYEQTPLAGNSYENCGGYVYGGLPSNVQNLGVVATTSSCTEPEPAGGQSYTGPMYDWALFIPATVMSLPGPGQDTVSPLNQTATGTNTPLTEDQQKAKAGQILTSSNPSYSTFNDYVCAQTTSACSVAPTDTTSALVTLPAITPSETYAQWKAAAQAAGLLGTISQSTLSDTLADPSVNPDDVVRTSPAAGTQVAADTAVAVYTNPDAITQGIGGAPPGVTPPGITLPQASTPCNVFPFGVPCWLNNQLGQFVSATPTAPQFSIGTPSLLGGGTLDVNLDHPFGADLGSIMAVVRIVLLTISAIGLVVWLAGFALGGSTGGGGTSEGDD